MSTCCHTPARAPAVSARPVPFGPRLLDAFLRYFGRSVVTRESADEAWLDTGLGRLDSATLADIGAPPALVDRAALRETWKLVAALDATRHL